MLVDQSDTMYYKFDVVHESRLHEKKIYLYQSHVFGEGGLKMIVKETSRVTYMGKGIQQDEYSVLCGHLMEVVC